MAGKMYTNALHTTTIEAADTTTINLQITTSCLAMQVKTVLTRAALAIHEHCESTPDSVFVPNAFWLAMTKVLSGWLCLPNF